MYCYVIIELSGGLVAGVWTYVRPEDAWEQYKRLKQAGADNLMIVKSIIGHLVERKRDGVTISPAVLFGDSDGRESKL